jgi:UPF0755 protein
MAKKLLIIFVGALILLGAFGFYSALKQRDELRLQREQAVNNAKAPEVSITLIEGWDNQQIGDYLQKNSITSSATFLSAEKAFDTSAYPILAGKPKSADLEGFIFPDTYFIPASTASGTDINTIIIEKALDNFSEKITPAMQAQATTDNMSLFQIITLASIIEKEAGDSQSDRNIISGIFYNRLKMNMALQSDATVDYITHKNDPSASAADIQIDSPYNTYKYTGLPPGPICNPSLGSIMAALYPQSTGYLYFLTDPATGRAVFATTYDEQIANKQKYLK